MYIIEIYMKMQYKSSITKNHRIKRKHFFDGVPLNDKLPFKLFLDFATEIKKGIVGKSSD